MPYRIDAAKWDAENQRATGMNKSLQTASEINDHLDYLKAEIIKVFRKYKLMDVMPTREQVKQDFNSRIAQNEDENWDDTEPDKQVTKPEKKHFLGIFQRIYSGQQKAE